MVPLVCFFCFFWCFGVVAVFWLLPSLACKVRFPSLESMNCSGLRGQHSFYLLDCLPCIGSIMSYMCIEPAEVQKAVNDTY